MSFVQKVRWLREARDPLPYYYTSSILDFLNIFHSHHYWFFEISLQCRWLTGCDQAYLFSVIDYIREKIVQVEYTSVTLTLQCVYMYIVIIRLQHNQKIFMVVHVQPYIAQSLCQHIDYASITRLPREIAFKHRILLLWLLRQEEWRGSSLWQPKLGRRNDKAALTMLSRRDRSMWQSTNCRLERWVGNVFHTWHRDGCHQPSKDYSIDEVIAMCDYLISGVSR